MAIRATVITASLRRIQPIPANGTNQTDVPTKNNAKNSSAPAMLAASAARTPAATNGGHRLTPVSNPKTAAPGIPCFLAEPIVARFVREDTCAHGFPTAYAYRSNTVASRIWIAEKMTGLAEDCSDTSVPTCHATAANNKYPSSRIPRKAERYRRFSRKPVCSASSVGTSTGPHEATQAGPDASPNTRASPNPTLGDIRPTVAAKNHAFSDPAHAIAWSYLLALCP